MRKDLNITAQFKKEEGKRTSGRESVAALSSIEKEKYQLFNYEKMAEEVSEEDIEKLKVIEIELRKESQDIIDKFKNMGELFESARKIFNGYKDKDKGFIQWYESLGFKKDFVKAQRDRFNLLLEHPAYQDIIQTAPIGSIIEVSKKDVPKKVLDMFLNGEVRSRKEIQDLRTKFEAMKKEQDEEREVKKGKLRFIEDAIIVDDKKPSAEQILVKEIKEIKERIEEDEKEIEDIRNRKNEYMKKLKEKEKELLKLIE